VAAAGNWPDRIGAWLLREVVRPLVADTDRLTFALDDTPTERYWRKVQGAGVPLESSWVESGLSAGYADARSRRSEPSTIPEVRVQWLERRLRIGHPLAPAPRRGGTAEDQVAADVIIGQ
jgi:hypothetical protein